MNLSLDPDSDMRWIYDCWHPDYNSERARDLRERRDVAIRSAPRRMAWEAQLNDALKEPKHD